MERTGRVDMPSFGAVNYSKIPAGALPKDLGERIVHNLRYPKNEKLAHGIRDLVEKIEAVGKLIEDPIAESIRTSGRPLSNATEMLEPADENTRRVRRTAENVVKSAKEIAYGKPGKKHDFFGALVQFFRAWGNWIGSGFKETKSFGALKDIYNKPKQEYNLMMNQHFNILGITMMELLFRNKEFVQKVINEGKNEQLFAAFVQIRVGLDDGKAIQDPEDKALWGVPVNYFGRTLGLSGDDISRILGEHGTIRMIP